MAQQHRYPAGRLRLVLPALLVLSLQPGVGAAQEGFAQGSVPLGEDGNPIREQRIGMSQGLLTRVLEKRRQVAIDGDLYEMPADLAVKDSNGAVRAPRYLEAGMYVHYRYHTATRDGSKQRVLTEVQVERHDPAAVRH